MAEGERREEEATGQDALAEMEDRWKRAAADLDNYRKRFDREVNRLRREERKTLLLDWLEIVDNLERALEHTTDTTDERLREGIQALHRQAMSILARYGVSRMRTIGEPFDPFRHEAVGQAEGTPSGTIVGEMLPGYEMEGEVLRPARVIVAR